MPKRKTTTEKLEFLLAEGHLLSCAGVDPGHGPEAACDSAIEDLDKHGFDALYRCAKLSKHIMVHDAYWDCRVTVLRCFEAQEYVNWLGTALVDAGAINAPVVAETDRYKVDVDMCGRNWPENVHACFYYKKVVLEAGIDYHYDAVKRKIRNEKRRQHRMERSRA